jgi:hypothetical protein
MTPKKRSGLRDGKSHPFSLGLRSFHCLQALAAGFSVKIGWREWDKLIKDHIRIIA